MKMLKDGEKKVFKTIFGIRVTAHRVDCETPVISIEQHSECITFTDADASDLINFLQKALDILPSSK